MTFHEGPNGILEEKTAPMDWGPRIIGGAAVALLAWGVSCAGDKLGLWGQEETAPTSISSPKPYATPNELQNKHPTPTPRIYVDPNKYKKDKNVEQIVDKAPPIDPKNGTYLLQIPGLPYAIRLPMHLHAVYVTNDPIEMPEPKLACASELEVEVNSA